CGAGVAVGNTITAFSIGAGGALTQVGTYTSGQAPQALAVGTFSGQEYLYSANYCSDNITTYTIGTSGALTPVGTPAQEPPQSGPHGMTLTPDGLLYVANYLSSSVNAFRVGSNGQLSAIGAYAAPNNASAVVATGTLP
ncbi:MAG TPA: beta-propeller fold lactonase family protein, partial [Acidiferrobacteraceae bacterium]|nr:beta-propeller fold lactonase family protein [Acidiferrobacteraceae bacterium]